MSKPVYMQNHSYENAFCLPVHFHANELIFIWKTLSETEAHGNSEMAYLLQCVIFVKIIIVLMLLFLILGIII